MGRGRNLGSASAHPRRAIDQRTGPLLSGTPDYVHPIGRSGAGSTRQDASGRGGHGVLDRPVAVRLGGDRRGFFGGAGGVGGGSSALRSFRRASTKPRTTPNSAWRQVACASERRLVPIGVSCPRAGGERSAPRPSGQVAACSAIAATKPQRTGGPGSSGRSAAYAAPKTIP